MQDRVTLIDWTLLPPNKTQILGFIIACRAVSRFAYKRKLLFLYQYFLCYWWCWSTSLTLLKHCPHSEVVGWSRLMIVSPQFDRLISSIILLLFAVSLLWRYYSKRDATHISEHHFLRSHNYTFRNLYILINVPSFLQKWYKSKSSLSLFDN